MDSIVILTIMQRWDDKAPAMLDSVFMQTYSNWTLYLIVSEKSQPEIQHYIHSKQYQGDKVVCVMDEDAYKKPMDLFCEYSKKGDFIVSVDGDDIVEPDFLTQMVAASYQYNADIVSCLYYVHEYTLENVLPPRHNIPDLLVIPKSEYTTYFRHYFYLFRVLWAKLIRTSLFTETIFSNIPSMIGVGGFGVDTMMVLNLLEQAEQIVVIPYFGYHYMVWYGSNSYEYKPGRETGPAALHSFCEEFLLRLRPKINSKNRSFLSTLHNMGLMYTRDVIFKSNLSPNDTFEKFHYMITEDLTQKTFPTADAETVQKPLQAHWCEYLQSYKELLSSSKVPIKSFEKMLYEMYLVLWHRTKDDCSFPLFYKFAIKSNDFLNSDGTINKIL